MTTRALVTGGGGFIGTHLRAALIAAGVEVFTLGARAGGSHHRLLADITDSSAIETVLREIGPEQIYHLAGIAHAARSAEFYRVNVGFAAALLDAAERSLKSTATLLLLGSAAEYGWIPAEAMPIDEATPARPDSHYGISKLAQTQIGLAAARRGVRVVLPRAFNVIGPGMPPHVALGDFARQIVEIEEKRRPPELTVGNLASLRDFVDVRTVAAALLAMMNAEACLGKSINICSGQSVRMQDLVAALIAASGRDIPIRVDPARYVPSDVPVSFGSGELLARLTGLRLSLDPARLCREVLDDARIRYARRP